MSTSRRECARGQRASEQSRADRGSRHVTVASPSDPVWARKCNLDCGACWQPLTASGTLVVDQQSLAVMCRPVDLSQPAMRFRKGTSGSARCVAYERRHDARRSMSCCCSFFSTFRKHRRFLGVSFFLFTCHLTATRFQLPPRRWLPIVPRIRQSLASVQVGAVRWWSTIQDKRRVAQWGLQIGYSKKLRQQNSSHERKTYRCQALSPSD
jgi:hypothetical protein